MNAKYLICSQSYIPLYIENTAADNFIYINFKPRLSFNDSEANKFNKQMC